MMISAKSGGKEKNNDYLGLELIRCLLSGVILFPVSKGNEKTE